MTANRFRPAESAKGLPASTLLVLAQPSPETDELFAPLVGRMDLCLLRVASVKAAEIALRDIAVSLVLVCPETEPDSVTAILDKIDELRRGTPLLVFRSRGGEHPSAWKARTIGILRCPIQSDVLNRTVDVALGLGVHLSVSSRLR